MSETIKSIENQKQLTGKREIKVKKQKSVYIVTEIADEKITVTPVSDTPKDNADNTVQPKIEVQNPQKLKLQKGDKVYVALTQQLEFISGLVLFVLPVLMAFGGYFLSYLASYLFHFELNEIIKFIFTTGFFVITSIFEFILTRNVETILKPQIILKV